MIFAEDFCPLGCSLHAERLAKRQANEFLVSTVQSQQTPEVDWSLAAFALNPTYTQKQNQYQICIGRDRRAKCLCIALSLFGSSNILVHTWITALLRLHPVGRHGGGGRKLPALSLLLLPPRAVQQLPPPPVPLLQRSRRPTKSLYFSLT